MTPARSLALKVAAVAAVYALLDVLSALPALKISFMMEAIWLPSGFLFAVLLRFPRRQWPLFLGAATLTAFTVNLVQRWTPGPALAFALTDPLEVLAGAWLATALLKGRSMDLSRIPDALILGLAGTVNGLLAGPLGLAATHLASVPLPSPFTGAVWSCSVLLSHLFLPPLVLAWPTERAALARRVGESLLWMAATTAVTRWGLHTGAPDGVVGLMMFLPFPLLVGAALRTGPWGAALSLLAISYTALLEGTHGHGPLPVQGLTPDLMLVWIQLFLATEALSILVLACAAEDQRRTQGSLLESESRYRHLVEQFPDAILLREGSRIRYANPAALELFGAAAARELEGRSIREFLDRSEPSSGELTNSGIHRYTAALRERILNTLDGRQIPVEVTDISIALDAKRPLTLDVFRDLSKRRAAEDALKRSELEFQRFFEMAPVPLLLVDVADSSLLQANAPSFALFEIPEGRLAGLHTSDFYVRQEDRTRLREEVLSKGRADGVEVDILTQKGRLRRVLVSAALVSHGGKDAILAGFMDVTLRMKTELALRQAQKLESLGLMAGGVAHDFNNLLTALIGNLELARMSLPDTGAAEPFFEAMAATLRRAGDLARQMLAYAGQAQVEIRPVDMNAAMREL
ncbi:MAG TPA: PAS domain S-box protein, partial [Holophagaceae bacterium]|nr:PAS domain S-box protein [Holophagaceae bacterium]